MSKVFDYDNNIHDLSYTQAIIKNYQDNMDELDIRKDDYIFENEIFELVKDMPYDQINHTYNNFELIRMTLIFSHYDITSYLITHYGNDIKISDACHRIIIMMGIPIDIFKALIEYNIFDLNILFPSDENIYNVICFGIIDSKKYKYYDRYDKLIQMLDYLVTLPYPGINHKNSKIFGVCSLDMILNFNLPEVIKILLKHPNIKFEYGKICNKINNMKGFDNVPNNDDKEIMKYMFYEYKQKN